MLLDLTVGFGPSHGYTDVAIILAAKEFWGVDVTITDITYRVGKNKEIWEADLQVPFASFYSVMIHLVFYFYLLALVRWIYYFPSSYFKIDGKTVLSLCRAYGFRNIQNVLRSIKRRLCKYDLIELLACPGGCTNGGGTSHCK